MENCNNQRRVERVHNSTKLKIHWGMIIINDLKYWWASERLKKKIKLIQQQEQGLSCIIYCERSNGDVQVAEETG